MPTANRGEVWLVDLGMLAKTRPCLVISEPSGDDDRALVALVPHTTAVRGTAFEVSVSAAFLKAGAFDTQNIITASHAKLVRRIGKLSTEDFDLVINCVKTWLGI
jgi:mRNA interferase MazF